MEASGRARARLFSPVVRMPWSATVVCVAGLLGGCASTAGSTAPSDAGTTDAPASASATCDPAGPHDAASFTYTATCAFAPDDAGLPLTCQEWWESADGDWSPFIASCFDAGGTLTSIPCSEAGVNGVCALAADCTDQTTIFYYGAPDAASARSTCAISAGATFSP